MKKHINLATPIQVNKNARLFFLSSLAVFAICFVTAMILLSYSLFLNNSYSSLKDNENNLTINLNQIATKKVQYLTIKERLLGIQKILHLRQNVNEQLDAVMNLFPNPITISMLTVSDNAVSVTANSSNLAALNDVIENKIPAFSHDPKSHVDTIQLTSFQQDPSTLQYSTSVTVTFKK